MINNSVWEAQNHIDVQLGELFHSTNNRIISYYDYFNQNIQIYILKYAEECDHADK